MHPTAQLVSNPAGTARAERTNEHEPRRDEASSSIEGAFAMLLGGMQPQATLSRELMDTLTPQQTEADKKKLQEQRASDQKANQRSNERRQSGHGAAAQPQETAVWQSSANGSQAVTRSPREAYLESRSSPSVSSTPAERAGAGFGQAENATSKNLARPQQDAFAGQQRSAENPVPGSALDVQPLSTAQITATTKITAEASALAPLLAAGQARATGGTHMLLAPNGSQGNTPSAWMAPGAARGGEKAYAKPQAQRGPQPEPSADPALRAQLARGLGMALRNGQGTATIRLDPQHLGTLRVDVSVRDHLVEAIFRPSSVEAQRLLEADRGALESALQARGLRVDRVEVRAPMEIPVHQPGENGPESTMDGRNGSSEADARHAQGEHRRGAGGAAHHEPGMEAPDRSGSVAEPADESSPRAETGGACHLIDTVA